MGGKQNSRIHAILFRNLRIHENFSGNSRKPDFFGKSGKIFGKIGEIFENRGEREDSRTYSRKNRADSRILAIKKWIFTFTQVFSIHAFMQFFLHFHAFTQPKKPIHAFTQTAGGPTLV